MGDWILGILATILGAIVLGIIAYGITWVCTPYGPNWVEPATVKALSYKASETHTGVGIGANGQSVVTTSTSSSQYNVVLKLARGIQWIVNDKNLFSDVEQGDKLQLTIRSKRIWGEENWDLVSWVKE